MCTFSTLHIDDIVYSFNYDVLGSDTSEGPWNILELKIWKIINIENITAGKNIVLQNINDNSEIAKVCLEFDDEDSDKVFSHEIQWIFINKDCALKEMESTKIFEL